MREDFKSKFSSAWKLFLAGITLLIGIFLVLAIMTFMSHQKIDLEKERLLEIEKKGPKVNTFSAKASYPLHTVELMGEARPFFSDQIYGRVSGYLMDIRVDIGDHVQQGSILARIESPETDKAYLSALSDSLNKSLISKRMTTLRKRRLVSQQATDQAVATAHIAQATLETQEVLKSYELLKAPFAGTLTARFVDPGTLIQNATNSQSSAQVLFTLSQTDRLRIYVYVDQKDAPLIHPGIPVEIFLSDHLNLKVKGTVTRISGELDPKTRTLLTEIDIKNDDQKIISGSFVRVRLQIPAPSYPEVPVKALIMKNNHPYLAIIRPNQTLHFQEISPGNNDGEWLQVLSGIHEGDTVAIDIGSTLMEGQKVQPQPVEKQLQGNPIQ